MIVLENVRKTYNDGKAAAFTALKDVNLKIGDTELIAIVGNSGAGKSTLMHVLACIDTCEDGTVTVDEQVIVPTDDKQCAGIRNKKFGIVLQDFALIPELTVLENIEIPLIFAGVKAKQRKEMCVKLLESVDMKDLQYKEVAKLSGGQKQRVAICRAVVNDPQYIFADEPTGSLDSEHAEDIFEMLVNLHKQGKTVVLVTHNRDLAARCNRVITVSDGEIVTDTSK